MFSVPHFLITYNQKWEKITSSIICNNIFSTHAKITIKWSYCKIILKIKIVLDNKSLQNL